MGTLQELADEAFADLLEEARHSRRSEGRAAQERIDTKSALQDNAEAGLRENEIMTTDPDPFEEGQRAARRTSRPKPIRIRTAATNMRSGPPATNSVAGAMEAGQSEGT